MRRKEGGKRRKKQKKKERKKIQHLLTNFSDSQNLLTIIN